MAMIFGIQNKKPAVAGPAPSMEELFDAYMSFESVDRATDIFLQKGQQLENALENLVIIGRAMKTHASAEGLATVKDIVRNELGTTVSMEAVKETALKVVAQIKDFFVKIGQWISEYFTRFMGWVLRAGKQIDKKIAAVKALKDGEDVPKWTYTGVDATNTRSVVVAVAEIKSAFQDTEGKGIADAAKTAKGTEKTGTHEVNGKAETLKVLEGAKALIAHSDELRKEMAAAYKTAKDRVSGKGANPDNIAALKTEQKRAKAAVGVARRHCGIFARTVASIAMRAKVKPGKAAEAPAAK